jgi:predicted enzyme related to lactoylglutathione lyase
MQGHPIVHLEISANDAKAASKFYHDVFGWKIEVDPNFNYHQFSSEGGPGGGFVTVPDQAKAGEVVAYLSSDDIDASLKKVEQAGGKVLVPRTEIPGVGWFANFADPTGNKMGLYTDNNRS